MFDNIFGEDEVRIYASGIVVRRQAVYLASISLMLAVAIYFSSYLEIFSYKATVLVAGTLGFICAAVLLYAYLWAAPIPVRPLELPGGQSGRIRTLIFQIEQVIQSISTYEGNTTAFTEDAVSVLKKRVENTFNTIKYSRLTRDLDIDFEKNFFDSEIGRKIIVDNCRQLLVFLNEKLVLELQAKDNAAEETKRSQENAFLIGTRVQTRLQNEIEQLFKRGNVYILFGTLVALAGGMYLYFEAKDIIQMMTIDADVGGGFKELTYKEIPLLVLRLSIVFFIEIFAFYFLKLHREAMENIKYYQNEMTNVDMKTISLNAAYSMPEAKGLEAVVMGLVATERNFILNEKQTTVEIEKIKMDRQVFSEALDKLASIFKKKD